MADVKESPDDRDGRTDELEGRRYGDPPASLDGRGLQTRHLRVRCAGAVVTVTMNRPQRRNALHPAAHAELAAVFDAYAADREARVLVLTGAGERAFCAGSDLKERARSGMDEMPATGFGGLTERFDLDKPVIAAVNGDAIGGGLELVLACDLAIAVRHARFGLPEPRVGLAAHGGLHRLARQVPLKRAMEIALTGRLFSADEALAHGLLNAVVDAAELTAEVERWNSALLATAPLALRATKQLMLQGLACGSVEAAFAATYPAYEALLDSADAREGMQAFIEKRAPVWHGR